MNIQSTQLSLPFHDVGKTQKLRETLEQNEAARQDLRDLIALPKDQAELRIQQREEAALTERLDINTESKWAKRLYGASAASLGGAVAAGYSGSGGLAVALGIGSMLLFAGGGGIAATAAQSRNSSLDWTAESMATKRELVENAQKDQPLMSLLQNDEKWMQDNEAGAGVPPTRTKDDSTFGKVKGAVNLALRAPSVLTTPLANALATPENLAQEAANESNGLSTLYGGVGALGGAGIGLALMFSGGDIPLTGLSPFGMLGVGALGLFGAGVGAALGGMSGLMAGQATDGLTTPLNIGRKTAEQLGDGEHSLWDKYKTGVELAASEAYALGQS